MKDEEYIADRIDNQIDWYNSKSQKAQNYFKVLRGIEIVAAAAIPLIAGFGGEHIPVNFVVAALGALIAVASAIISLNQYQENWIEYRTTCESITHEKFLFMTKSEPYDKQNAYSLFVQRAESLISKENISWSQYTKTKVGSTKIQPDD